MDAGRKIAEARKRAGMTQEKLAERLGVSFQAVSMWERGETLPDIARLAALASALDLSLDALFREDDSRDWTLRSMEFNAERMYTFVKTRAAAEGLTQTLAALPLMRIRHEGQFRRGRTEKTPYAAHPLTLACHALSMGLADDDLLAALLLHDILEDTDARPEELPVGERALRAVRLVSRNLCPGGEEAYYAGIAQDALASLVKCFDRCHNLSCMADGFSREKMARYVSETERRFPPLMEKARAVPEWSGAVWLLRYQTRALLETFKRLL